MAWFSNTRASSGAKSDGPSLNDILDTPQLRNELALILALSTDALRRKIDAPFDLSRNNGLLPGEVQTDKTRNKAPPAYDFIDLQDEQEALVDERLRACHRRYTELSSCKTQALRRAALTYFDKWQSEVLRRIGEVLSVKPGSVRAARAQARKVADEALHRRQESIFEAWANGGEPSTDALELPDDLESFSAERRLDLLNVPRDKRVIVLNSVLLLLLSLEHYTSHSRELMQMLARTLQLPTSFLVEQETKVAEALLSSAASQMSADESTKRQAAEGSADRRWKVGIATVAGAALIGITGGLAAPVLAGALGGIMGHLGLGAIATLLGPLATNFVLVGGLFGAYGGSMTGRMIEKYAQEVSDFKFVPTDSAELEADFDDESKPPPAYTEVAPWTEVEHGQQGHRLRVAIGISGWLSKESDFVVPWRVISNRRIEAFALRWETEALLNVGKSFITVLKEYAWDFAKFQVMTAISVGLWPLGLLRAHKMLDNPFAIARSRSEKAGKVLADALIHRVQGERPVTLIGYSLGASVVYHCLLELADQSAFGLVETAVLMGAPVASTSSSWRRVRTAVTGRVVNVFSSRDFMLGFLHRAGGKGIAGIEAVKDVFGVENHDFTDMIQSHAMYQPLVGTILQRIGFEDLDVEAVVAQQAATRSQEQRMLDKETRSEQTVDRKGANAAAKLMEDGNIEVIDAELHHQVPNHSVATTENVRLPRNKPAPGVESNGEKTEYTSGDNLEVAEGPIELCDEEQSTSLAEIEPAPESDHTVATEMVHFGSGSRGFDIEWKQSG